MNILVTGANGQLGNEMRRVSSTSSNQYIFTDVAELDITSRDSIRKMVNDNQIHVIVNCAAYTNVDKAEDDFATADLLNNKAVENLAVVAKEADATVIHVSTDYVFQGDRNVPCREDWETNPLGVYGKTKLAGEHSIQDGDALVLLCQNTEHLHLVARVPAVAIENGYAMIHLHTDGIGYLLIFLAEYHKLHTFSLGIHHIVEYQVFYHHRTETEYYLSNSVYRGKLWFRIEDEE